jgi:hypothetical protein
VLQYIRIILLEFGLIVSNRSLRIGISKVTQSFLETG